MQTFITDRDFYKSASNLTRQHLQAQIYEGIHILASLLDCTDKLVNPKKNVKNYPQAILWAGYEKELNNYLWDHYKNWLDRGYSSKINRKNLEFIMNKMYDIWYKNEFRTEIPSWITYELIQTHRSVLIQKEIEKEYQFDWDKYEEKFCLRHKCKICEEGKRDNYGNLLYGHHCNNKDKYIEQKYNEFHHYRNLWPDCQLDLKMRYDWRGKSV